MTKGVYIRTKKPWNYGLTSETDERVKKGAEAQRGHIAWNINKTGIYSAETLKRMSISKIGDKNPMKNPEVSQRVALKSKGKPFHGKHWDGGNRIPHTLEIRKIIGDKLKGRKPTPEQIKNVLRRRYKSSLEIKFEDIINRLGLPYKFVGNGEIIVARKCPDFVDSNGKKIAIEVYYRKHKQKFRGDVEIWKAERMKLFNENGWELLFFDETQVNEDNVKSLLLKN